ncbi:histidine phosphatase family protein [Streptacidiphilus jiangxiensis]|uniref:Alpha-ribazole phosphatase/probable phosphoglycerate mutase n=1 Tax=Streptacidiphilus jiangxiensis TaxID=235985 RepID=A0A1H7MWT3_STRJI|nr:histidine phosphatase family protein [Streptacidiphilus jiangxiensis]SEL15551.1 alpha-ribazole phosphatase/probable phosphoglycerate mutase [Streptacidiphilus jiangxiensis]
MALELVYETHATTVDNEAGIATGWLPGRLSPLGRRQADELGERRRGGGFAAVYSSDLYRAVETAQIAFPPGGGGPELRQDRRLRECDYGALNGAPAAAIAEQRVRRLTDPFPGGQSYCDVLAATASFLRDLLASERDGSRILLIAHSANRWSLDALLTGARLRDVLADPPPWRPGWHYALPADWSGGEVNRPGAGR